MESSTDSVDKEMILRKQHFEEMLNKMKLSTAKPLTLIDAITIKEKSLSLLNSISHTSDYEILLHLVLHKLMMSDSSCRKCLFNVDTTKCENDPDIDSNGDVFFDCEDVVDDGVHPMDCLLGILHCCDNFLRQDLIHKMSLCQLAIPFLVPNPVDFSLTIYLWGMRSIVKSWKSKRYGEMECRMVDYKGPIISTIRVGEMQLSKSKMLNEIISEQKHEIFFNWDCNEFNYKRKFVDGVVELCCYFPRGKENSLDFYPEAITFLNLHGDALDHTKQVNFVKSMNFLSVVFIAEDSFDDKNIKILQSLAEAPGGIILLVAEGGKSAQCMYSAGIKKLHNSIPGPKLSCIKLFDKPSVGRKKFDKPLVRLKKEIWQKIVEKLDNSNTEDYQMISGCVKFADTCGIKVDEDIQCSKTGLENAKMIFNLIKKECETEKQKNLRETQNQTNLAEVKKKILPLQGSELWHKWAENNKELYRHVRIKISEMNIANYNAKIKEENKVIRKKQLEYSTSLSPAMRIFLNGLTSKCSRKYFLQWLKMLLDDYSREMLPTLRTEYQVIRDKLLKSRVKVLNTEEKKSLENQLRQKSQQLVNSSIGLEHFFREMGQIYEARKDLTLQCIDQNLKDEAEYFSQIMAELMLDGYPFELMDGDASHVPLTWATAVIEKLKYACCGGKLFILSILGIQSSGKSTLLNTMFGLRFNVSAGRCTRGAFCQIIPIDNVHKGANGCSYIMVVDTEGLRAPELQLQGLKHDNELATFVIGLADTTIINISGEAQGDLNDILQTTVHAFIRMKATQMTPSCHFVHQNVQDALANSKNMEDKSFKKP